MNSEQNIKGEKVKLMRKDRCQKCMDTAKVPWLNATKGVWVWYEKVQNYVCGTCGEVKREE